MIGHLWGGSFVLLDTVFFFCKMVKLDVDVYHKTRSVKTFIKYRIEEHHMCPLSVQFSLLFTDLMLYSSHGFVSCF